MILMTLQAMRVLIFVKSFPKPLSTKEESYYLRLCKEGDKEARDKLIEHNLRLVAHIVKKYNMADKETDDLISIGTIGLIKAIDTFDGFWYEGWEGHFDLVKLNLNNSEVVNHILGAIKTWVELFDIDGLRLDVAYCLDKNFLKTLRSYCDNLKPEFFLFGEILFGDYRQLVNDQLLHSCTNYECYKGLYSSFNEQNLFEISYSLNRQFGPEAHAIYRGLNLITFADNHDVSRLSTIIREARHIPLLYGLLFTMPGIPCIYYGSEWGVEGDKKAGDDELRPCFSHPVFNDLTAWIKTLCTLRSSFKSLRHGGYNNIGINNRQLVFEREYEGERILTVINSDDKKCYITLNLNNQAAKNLFNESRVTINNGLEAEPYSFSCYLLS